MNQIQSIRGTKDYLPQDMTLFKYVVQNATQEAARGGFLEIATPLLEHHTLFHHSAGQDSDIVAKEMYYIIPRGQAPHDATVVLRPEGTAGVARAILSNGLLQNLPLRFFYQGPMFRYDRPQKGRLRQFHQVAIEHLGEPDPWADVDVLLCAVRFLKSLGIYDGLRLELNTLGDIPSRLAYHQALVAYLQKRQNDLSPTSQVRLARNPLRILDSKDPQDQELIQNAPFLDQFLTNESALFFQRVQDGLRTLGIPYTLNPRLVRGLDYYCHTAFEFISPLLGAQSTVLGGGRYDGLMETLKGPSVAGVGWAAGVERLMILTQMPASYPSTVGLIAMEELYIWDCLQIAESLRQHQITACMLGCGDIRKFLKKNQDNCAWAIIIGQREKERGYLSVKNIKTRRQETVLWDQIVDFFVS